MEYPVFKNLAPESIKHGHRMEQMALDKCRFAVFSSEWAVNTAIDSYGVDPRKLRIAPLGANLDCSRTLDDVARLVDARSPKKCKLLFMGVDWIRKGGDVAFEVARELNARGLETTLTIAGCEPQIEKPFPGFVKSMGFINKFEGDNGRILEGLLGESHFLIVPSTAEAFGAVFCEASSFATPSLARRVGGIPTAVKDGVSGKLFARDAGASEYCDYILSLFEDYSKYRALALTAFREYESRLNWERTSQTLMGLFREIESTTSR
jgi:glycosyltransferase involved in cell wall biosynthesis